MKQRAFKFKFLREIWGELERLTKALRNLSEDIHGQTGRFFDSRLFRGADGFPIEDEGLWAAVRWLKEHGATRREFRSCDEQIGALQRDVEALEGLLQQLAERNGEEIVVPEACPYPQVFRRVEE